jgi:hypothetical protein
MNQDKKVVKISDVVENQIPEFILTENPNLVEFLQQYYISQEYQGATIDLVENLVDYKNFDSFDSTNLIKSTVTTQEVSYFDDVINVDSTHGWPSQYGLLKIDDEIITYTGIEENYLTGICTISVGSNVAYVSGIDTSLYIGRPFNIPSINKTLIIESVDSTSVTLLNTVLDSTSDFGYSDTNNYAFYINSPKFTGCIRGFSGVESLSDPTSPEYLKFSSSEVDEHENTSTVYNLSNLFLLEFFRKIKYQFSPGFEEFDFDPRIDAPNFISKVKNFYQTKGTDEAFRILFKVLYGEEIDIIKPKDFLFTPSDDQWIVVERFIGEAVNGDPLKLNGQTLYQDQYAFTGGLSANGSIYKVSSASLDGNQYYNIDIFSGYSNNLNPKGSIFGEFKITPKTYCTENVLAGSTTIPVVSTIGFPKSGFLVFGDLIIDYQDKTNTEFLNCYNITEDISSSSAIYAENFAYSYENGDSDKLVKIRLLNTISQIDTSNTILATKNDLLKIDNIGEIKENKFTKSLVYNIPSIITVGKVYSSIPSGKFGINKNSGQVKTQYKHYLRNGDIVEVYSKTLNQKLYDAEVSNVTEKGFTLNGTSQLSIGHSIKLFRKVFKSFSSNYPEVNQKFSINIQNSYEDSDNYYLTSNGFNLGNINSYKREYTLALETPSAGISTSILGSHQLYDGELVTVSNYTIQVVPGTVGFRNNVGIYTGLSLYAKRIDSDEIKLAFTKQDLYDGNYINFAETISEYSTDLTGYVKTIKLTLSKLYGNQFTSSKLFKKIPKDLTYSQEKTSTPSGSIGVFVNGIEIQNYKSFDKVYSGEIKSIDILDGGDNYSLSNPPQFDIDYGNDTTTILTPNLIGNIKSVSVLDPGFDYLETPIVKIKGGGNDSVRTEVKLKKIQKEISFNSQDPNVVITTDPINKFVFEDPHRLVVGDAVIYESFENTPIANLQNNGIYYIFDVGAGTSFKLAANKLDAFAGIGTINIGSGGKGLQRFTSVKTVSVIDSVNVIDLETEFKYKKLPLIKENVNHYDDILEFENHGFLDGDEVEYSYTGTSILSTASYYYVIKIDDNKFKLSSTKDLSTPVNISSSNTSSVHYFSYSPIRAQIKGRITKVGVSEIGYSADLLPIVTGSIENVNVCNSKTYSSTILNFEKPPRIQVKKGRYASIKPIIINGKIVKVLIQNPGENYFNNISIQVIGSGTGAELQPIITNGQITDVKILSPGIGYDQYTRLLIKSDGSGASLKANITQLNLNEVSKYSSSILNRGLLVGQKQNANRNTIGVYYLTPTLTTEFGISSDAHSKIIGWAYDGCPIYGPYAYENVDGTGNIIRMTSSYRKVKISPSISNSSTLDCAEDYVYRGGRGTLDEFNGRYCVTPEYPNGVYAYFATSTFPYFIGPNYRYSPVIDNFDPQHTQDLNIGDLGIFKHTFPYYVEDKDNYYDYFDFYPNIYSEDISVIDVSEGTVDDIEIIAGGRGYSIGDKIVFNNEGTEGFGASAEVSELRGVGISSVSSETITSSDATFIQNGDTVTVICNAPIDLQDEFYVNIDGISNSLYSTLEGNKKITFTEFTTKLSSNLSSGTGAVTEIKVTDSISIFDIDSQIKIGTETLTVIGFDYINNSIVVSRGNDSLSASAQTEVTLLQNKFQFKESKDLNIATKNETYYFDSELISIGTDLEPAGGNTITKTPLIDGKSETRFVRNGAIWMPNHKFKHGEEVTYTRDPDSDFIRIDDSPSTLLLDQISPLYVVDLGNDLIGFVDDKTKINSTDDLLLFVFAGTGKQHKLVTNRSVVTGDVLFNQTTVYTNSRHNLLVGDVVNIDLTSKETILYTVTRNSSTAKLRINSQNNPELVTYRNQTLEFDTSGLGSSEFKLYLDENFENEYLGNSDTGLEVIKTSDKLTLTISDNTPSKLYYNLETTNDLYQDLSVRNGNSIQIIPSKYSSISTIVDKTNRTYTINLPVEPEVSEYLSGDFSATYSVLKSNATGSIKDVRITSKGVNYKKIPTISEIESTGKNAILIPITNSIGKINKIESISNFICPSDKTLKPSSNLYSLVYLKNHYKVSNINLTYGGSNYLSPPTIKIYNEDTNKIYDQVGAYCELSGGSVSNIVLYNEGSGLPKNGNKAIFTDNSNGLKILDATSTLSGENYLVSLTVETPISGFTTSSPIPFEVGDEIFVEGIVSLGYGFNSSKYEYETFTVVGIVTNYSSPDQSIIRYELPNSPGTPVSYDLAYVINAKDIPTCELTISESEFYANEIVDKTKLINNKVDTTSKSTIKVYDSSNISIGEVLEGSNSKSKGTVIKIDSVIADFDVSSSKSKSIGWITQRGNLSEITQKLPDNDYYQNFSYSLKSKQEISKWESPVSDLTHVAGLKKFGDLQVESKDSNPYQITTNDVSDINISLTSYVNINTINDIDLVLEDVDDHQNLYSEILKFRSLKLSDYLLCLNNRVLSIDDISNNFNTDESFVSIIIDTTPTYGDGSLIAKYLVFLESTKSFYTDFELPSLSEIYLARNNSDVNFVAYSYFEDIELGAFNARIRTTLNNKSEIVLELIPYSIFNILSAKTIKELVPLDNGIVINDYGNTSNVAITTSLSSQAIPSERTINLCDISECKSGNVYVGISTGPNSIEEFIEFTFLYNGTSVIQSVYAENEIRNLGEVGIKTGPSSNIQITYTGIPNTAVKLYINANLLVETSTNPKEQTLAYGRLNSDRVQFTASTLDPVGITTITKDYAASKYVIEVEKTIGATVTRNIIQINSVHYDIVTEIEKYLNNVNYGIIGNFDDLEFSTIFDPNQGTYTLAYYPSDLADYDIKFYEKNIERATNPLL